MKRERELAFALTLIVQDDSECPILILQKKHMSIFKVHWFKPEILRKWPLKSPVIYAI